MYAVYYLLCGAGGRLEFEIRSGVRDGTLINSSMHYRTLQTTADI
jgi:hypothetical protein